MIVIENSELGVEPEAVSFAVNLNAGTLTLVFNEPVNASSVNFTELTLRNSQTSAHKNLQANSFSATEFYTLTNGSTPSSDSLTIIVVLSQGDLNAVTEKSSLLTSLNTSYISFTQDAFQDLSDNPVVARPFSNALPASMFIDDGTRPTLSEFYLDMNEGSVTLVFDETVNITSFNISGITLHRNADITLGESLRLTEGTLVTSESSTVIVFDISDDDLNELKRLEIGTSIVTSFITLSQYTVADMTGNLVVAENGAEASSFTRDTTAPELNDFDLDLSNNTLTLYFSETVRAAMVDVTQYSIQNMDGTVLYELTDDSQTSTADSTIITIALGIDDLNNIKLDTGIATSEANTYLSLTSEAVFDMAGNSIENITSIAPVQVRNYTQDLVSPELTGFTLDLTNDTLTLTFSETVNASSLDPTQITVQGESLLSNETEFVTLTAGMPGPNGPVIQIMLNNSDLNSIKQLLNLAISETNTFISFTSSAIADMNGNSVESITNTSARMASLLVEDSAPPVLESFVLDLNSSLIVLTFSETVSTPSIDFTKIILQDGTNASNFYQLLTGSVQEDNSSIITVSILKVDRDNILENLDLATDPSNTYLRLLQGAITDMNGNLIEEIDDESAIQAENVIADNVDPELVEFRLDLDSGTIIAIFSEPVLVQSFNFSSLVLQSDQFLSNLSNASDDVSYRLTGGNSTERNFTGVNITLTTEDLNNIKQILEP